MTQLTDSLDLLVSTRLTHLLFQAFNQNMIAEGKPLKVRVEFSLEDPLGGVHFVVPEGRLYTRL